MRCAVGVHPGDVDDGQAAGRVRRGAHAGSGLGSVRRPVWRAASRASSARATRSRRRSATSRLDSSGRSSRDAVRGEDRDPVRVGPEARAGLRDVVGDEQVDALAARASRRRGRASRSRRRTRRGSAAARAARGSARRRCRDRGRSGRPRRGGPGSARARGVRPAPRSSLRSAGRSGRKSATAAAMTRASKPARPSAAWVSRSSAARSSAVDSTRTTSRRPGAARPRRSPAISVTRAPRASAASAIATPIRPVERLPMKRTGSIASRVPPAVTTTCRPARSASRAGPASGGRAAGIRRRGPADRRRPRRPRPRSRGSSASRPTPDWPGRERARSRARRSCSRIVAQPGDVARAWPGGVHMSPSIAGATTTGAPGREAGGGHDVAGQAVGHRPEPVRGGRRDDDRVGRVADDDVADPAVGQQLQQVGLDRVARQRLERERPDELGRGRRQHHRDVGALGLEQAQQLDRLVGGDRAGDARAPMRRPGAGARRAAASRQAQLERLAAADLGVQDREALERQVRVDRVDALAAPAPTAPPTGRRSGSPGRSPARRRSPRPARARTRSRSPARGPGSRRSCPDCIALHGVAADRPVRGAQLDPRQLGGPCRERLEPELEAGRDRARRRRRRRRRRSRTSSPSRSRRRRPACRTGGRPPGR